MTYLQFGGKDIVVATFFWTKYVLYVAEIYQKRDDDTLAANGNKTLMILAFVSGLILNSWAAHKFNNNS